LNKLSVSDAAGRRDFEPMEKPREMLQAADRSKSFASPVLVFEVVGRNSPHDWLGPRLIDVRQEASRPVSPHHMSARLIGMLRFGARHCSFSRLNCNRLAAWDILFDEVDSD